MNRCPSRQQLHQFLAEQLGEGVRRELEAHVEGCAACQDTLGRLSDESEEGKILLLDPLPLPVPESAAALVQRLREKPPSTEEARFASPEAIEPSPIVFPGPPTARGPLGQLDSFAIRRELGQGTFGVVYQAYDELDRLVAIKILKPELAASANEQARFEREARQAAAVKHDHIVTIHQVGHTPGFPLPYLVMEYLDGEALSERLERQGLLEAKEAARIVQQVALALAAAHARGLVHRDVKPSNILLDKISGRAKLTDFGLARRIEATGVLASQSGRIVGTPAYMSPEQIVSPGRIDGRSDVYGLGGVFYELLTGERPFRGLTHLILRQVVHDEPRPPRKLNDRIPRDLETITLKCLAKEPGRRYQTAGELADDLQRFLAGEPIQARPVGVVERLWRWCRRNPVVAGLTAAAALFLLAGTGVSSYFAIQANQRARDTLSQKERADEKTAEALANAKLADDSAVEARANLYAARMNLAQVAWESGHLTRVPELLDFYRNPQPGKPELRGWEWYYQERLCHDELRTLVGHTNSVVSVAFSPDGTRLASADSDGTMMVWDAAGGQALLTLKVRNASVISLAYSPDGRRLASAAVDGMVKVWDAASGQEMRTLKGDTWVNCAAFSPDGKRLAVPSGDQAVKLWDIASNQELRTFEQHTNRVSSVAFSADGQRLASADVDGMVKVWDAASGKELRTFKGHTDRVLSVGFSADGTRLASASDDRTVKVWDVANGQDLRTLKGHSQAVPSVVFSPDGGRLASAGKDGTVKVWDAATGHELCTLKGHVGSVRNVAFSPDGARLASAGGDGTVKLWAPAAGEEPRTLKGHNGQPIFRPVTGIMAAVNSVAFSPDGRRLASADTDGTVKVWDAVSGQELRTLHGLKRDLVMSVVFSPDGKWLASGARARGVVTVWDAANGQPLRTFPGQAGQCAISLTFSPDGARLASADSEATVRVWNAASGQPLSTLKEVGPSVQCRTFSPDGALLAIAGDDRLVRLWDVANRQELWAKGHTERVLSVAFSADGTRLASGSDDRTVKVWDVANGQELRTLEGHSQGVLSVAFSPRGERLASGSYDNTVKVWDVASGQEVRTLKEHTGCVLSVAFSPDGWRLASASSDMTVKVWDARPLTPDVQEEREALGLVEVLFAKAVRKADVVENLRRNPTISEAVRHKALALADVYWSSLVQQQASGLVDSLFAKRLFKRQVLQAVRNNQAIIEDVRQEALALAERWPEDSGSFLAVPVVP